MPKADIELKSGTRIVIEGSEEDIVNIISDLERRQHFLTHRFERLKEYKKGRQEELQKQNTLTSSLIELKNENYFNQPKSLKEIQEHLKMKAMFYPTTTLSSVMLRLVRKGDLRRLKEEDLWKYVAG